MQHYGLNHLEEMERIYRGNLVNSITGYKSANLLATRSQDGIDNLAIFSSVVHLGSDPALFGFVQRPLGHGAGDTYNNLKSTGVISLNHLPQDMVSKGHQSSAKYDSSISEFEKLDIVIQRRANFQTPFVKGAPVQVAAAYESEYYLQENKCIFVICRITDIFLNEGIQAEDGWVNLEKAGSVSINGLDAYASAKTTQRWSYAQVDKEVQPISTGLDYTKDE